MQNSFYPLKKHAVRINLEITQSILLFSQTLVNYFSIAIYEYFKSFARLVPESIRWHITHNKHKEALGTAAKIASLNKKPLPGDLSIEVTTSVCGKQPADYNIMDLFKTPRIRKRAIIMFYIW